MPIHDFKSITVVPSSKELVNICLSKTQRKTPTVIHKGANVGTLRKFYIRKVKTCGQNYHDKLEQIITDFPDLKSMHPFYSNLINTLYGETEFKEALRHLNAVKNMIDRIGSEHCKLIKFGDSQYRCKALKRVALGKMTKLVSKSSTRNSLQYLEDCRQHLSRLPSIDTSTRTVILCGYPNVGKSSFLNKVSRAEVDVQPYAFTTKSLFVGHTDYENNRWQFIDTPGLLDRAIVECNTAEMLAINALTYLDDAGIMFILDLSERCGYSIKQQTVLLANIRAIFGNKPLIVGLNKTDIAPWDSINAEDKALIEEIIQKCPDATLVQMSTLSESGVMEARNAACDLVLKNRVSRKLDKISLDTVKNRLHIANRANVSDVETIPENILARLTHKAECEAAEPGSTKHKTLLELQKLNGDLYFYDKRDEWDIPNPEERGDIIPEVYNGHNIADFGYINAEALKFFIEEEERLDKVGYYDIKTEYLSENKRKLAKRIREAEAMKVLESQEKKNSTNVKSINRVNKGVEMEDVQEGMKKMGVTISDDATGLIESKKRSRSKSLGRRKTVIAPLRAESISRCDVSRSRSRSGVRDEAMALKVDKIVHDKQKIRNRYGRKGEGDHHIGTKMPQHLFSGKRGIGKTDRR